MGSHRLELNPYFKDGGTGMPPTEEEMRAKQRKPEKRKQEISYEDEMEAMWAERDAEVEPESRPKKRSKHEGKCKSLLF